MFDLQLDGSPHVPGVGDHLAQPGDGLRLRYTMYRQQSRIFR